MDENGFAKIESMIARHVGAFADSIQHKLDLVVGGHQMLSEKIDRVEERLDGRIDCVVRKLAAVAVQGNATRPLKKCCFQTNTLRNQLYLLHANF